MSRSPCIPVPRYRLRSVLRVAPQRGSSGSGWWSPKSPWVSHPPVASAASLRVSPNLFPLASPAVKLRVAPALRSSGSVGGPDFQVALNLRSSAVADDWICGSPRLTVPRLSVYASSGCPGSAIYGWVDDESLAVRELCILSLRRG